MSEEPGESEKKRKYATRSFPKNTLLDSLRIAQSIHDNNADQPYNRLDLAKSIDYTPESSTFRTLITSSGRFGLTKGSYQSEKIALTELGKSIVTPKSDQEKAQSLKQALFNIDLYRKFYSQFDGHKLPKREFLKNTLNRDFGIPISDCDECYDMIIKNSKELKLFIQTKDAEYIKLNKLVPTPSIPTETEEGRKESKS